MTKVDFKIRGRENIAKAAEAIRDRNFRFVTNSFNADDPLFLCYIFDAFGFRLYISEDEELAYIGEMSDDHVDADSGFEEVLRTIKKFVEPGAFIEILGRGGLFRYVFLYDTVEKWTVPYILYAKKEAI